jgi:hypothetical protein
MWFDENDAMPQQIAAGGPNRLESRAAAVTRSQLLLQYLLATEPTSGELPTGGRTSAWAQMLV